MGSGDVLGKRFFFERKNRKTFIPLLAGELRRAEISVCGMS